MVTEPLDVLPLWLLVAILALLLWLALEAGYRCGRWRHTQRPNEHAATVGAIVASILGLLALMLGFTFSFAASRFDARREAVLEEANAIGAAFLRTRVLPAEQRVASERALKEYVDVRLQAVRSKDVLPALTRSREIHESLWNEAMAAATSNPSSEMVALYVDSLNQLIDVHAKRVQAGVRSRIPVVMWLGLICMSLMSLAAVGYLAGLSEMCRSPAMAVLILSFTVVLALIADLDRSQEGLLRVSQQALVDVQMMIDAKQP
ncbi:hypothetical protein NA78x_002955 [Anatilimnocola sp. NA78]|uniref:bestrophin-like domain n=1 Tax=Anatilimnocola sp. NA78 TaxID=3415683 RepID=UPI003CE46D6E